jgi:hypothetical protein
MKYVAVILILLAVALSTPQASAQPFPRQGGAPQMQSLNAILANIRNQFPGQLSDVQGPRNGILIVKWLTPDGQILFIEADMRTGQIVGVRGDGNFRRQNFVPAPDYRQDRERPRARNYFEPPPATERRRGRRDVQDYWQGR